MIEAPIIQALFALGGVFVTLIVTVSISTLQRKNDRATPLYDRRISLYGQYASIMLEISRIILEDRRLIDQRVTALERDSAILAEQVQILSGIKLAPLSPQQVRRLLGISSLSNPDEGESGSAPVDVNPEPPEPVCQREQLDKGPAEFDARVREAARRLTELLPEFYMVSGPAIREEANRIALAVVASDITGLEGYAEFFRLIRRELGVRDQSMKQRVVATSLRARTALGLVRRGPA